MLSVSWRFWLAPGAYHTVFQKEWECMFYICVPKVFFVCFVVEVAKEECSNLYEKCSDLSIFSHLGPFFRVFGQVKEWTIPRFVDLVNFLFLVSRPIVFCPWSWPASNSAAVYWKWQCFRFVFHFGMESFCNTKDRTLLLCPFNIVFEFVFPGCSANFVGKIESIFHGQTHKHAWTDKDKSINKHLEGRDCTKYLLNVNHLTSLLFSDNNCRP